jgi:hypothetical protein
LFQLCDDLSRHKFSSLSLWRLEPSKTFPRAIYW